LKEEFNTQQKVEQYFLSKEDNEENRNIKQGLFDLISNVILFDAPGANGQKFHFRIDVEKTSSFLHLDWNTRQQLKDLYINYFYRRQDDFWYKEAMKKLPAMRKATNMLVCGEDLGMVPHCVPDVMKQLGLLSLEVQRMPKDPGKEFSHPKDAPYLSVVTPSTHDMSTIRGWWEEDRELTQKFYNNELGMIGEAPRECEPAINQAIVQQHLDSPAMWTIFLLQDILGIDEKIRCANPHEERINIPADPKHFWKYRMHLFLEDLLKAKDFNEQLKELLHISGR
jgi:4-alpha-glucanotransferase